MTYLLDTNVISELRKGARCDAGVRDWFEAARPEQIHVSVLTIGELRRGVGIVQRRDPAAGRALDLWLSDVVGTYAEQILRVGHRVAQEWGRLNVPDPLPAIDGLLAATASVHRLTLVTRNTKDVQRTGVPCTNPFSIGA